MQKSPKYTYQVGHEASEISLIVAVMVCIVDEMNALLRLFHILKGKCPYIEHRPRRAVMKKLGDTD